MLNKEKEFYSSSCKLIVGVDEAGRGPLAGPVFAAAALFAPDFEDDLIDDSKKLTAKKALAYGIASVSADDIDKYNIYEATKICMKKAIEQIGIDYDLIITDAMPLYVKNKKVIAMIKGDAQCLNVAAASILAKVSRDRYMDELDKQYPEYGFAKHKGYGTKAHIDAINKYGPIDHVHRKTFAPIKYLLDDSPKLC